MSPSRRPGPNALGFLAAAGAAVLWGLSGVVVKVALRGTLHEGALLVLRLVLSVVTLAAGVAAVRPRQLWTRGEPWGVLVALGVAMLALQWCYYRTIQATNVATAVFLQFLSPVFVVGFGWVTGRQPREKWSALAVATAIAGGYLLVASGATLQLPAIALATGLGAAVALAAQTLLFDRIPARVPRVGALLAALSVSAVLSLPLGEPESLWRTHWTLPVIGAVGYMAILATVVPLLLAMAAVRLMGAARTGVTGTLEPVVASAGAALLLGEGLALRQIVGGLLIVSAIGLIQLAPAEKGRERARRAKMDVGTVDNSR